MEFHNREGELKQLADFFRLSSKSLFFLRLTGRRRIGKTELINQFVMDRNLPVLYFYVTRQNPVSLLNEFQQVLAGEFPEYRSIQFENLSRFFQTILDLHIRQKIITIFDEFQNFQMVQPDTFSILQKELDLRQKDLKGMLIVIGSLHSMMLKLFDDANQPLFGRINATMHLSHFPPSALVQLLQKKQVDSNRLLDFYSIFQGIPYYYKLVDDYRLWKKPVMAVIGRLILKKDSILVNEGLELLLGEFGKNYSSWFSILKAIAMGHTRLSEIVNHSGVVQQNINRYLSELIGYYRLVVRRRPLGSKPDSKNSRYYLSDHFLTFWFRYIYRYQSLLEFGGSERLKEIVRKDFATYKGRIFERLIMDHFIEQNSLGNIRFDDIGSWWDRGRTEIDIITVSHLKKEINFYECKLKRKRFNKSVMQGKVSVFLRANPEYHRYKSVIRFISEDGLDYSTWIK